MSRNSIASNSIRECRFCKRKFRNSTHPKSTRYCSSICFDRARKKTCLQCGEEYCQAYQKSKFCCIGCKADWQRGNKEFSEFVKTKCKTLKPVSREWLIEKYVKERKSTYAIAKLVNRSASTVVGWFHQLKIPLREPWDSVYVRTGWHHSEEMKERMSKLAIATGRVPFDPKVGSYMKGRKGADTPNWKGGITSERQKFYSTEKWKQACKEVWARDKATCQRCGKCKNDDRSVPFDIHHISPFDCEFLQSVVSNLVLLCEKCHYWVHSKSNTKRLFIKPCMVAFQSEKFSEKYSRRISGKSPLIEMELPT